MIKKFFAERAEAIRRKRRRDVLCLIRQARQEENSGLVKELFKRMPRVAWWRMTEAMHCTVEVRMDDGYEIFEGDFWLRVALAEAMTSIYRRLREVKYL